MINFARILETNLTIKPFPWAQIGELYSDENAEILARTYPVDHFKTVEGNDGEKGYLYEARSLIHMGADKLSFADDLSDAWRAFGQDLLSPNYREAMSLLTGYDLRQIAMEAHVYHYDPGCYLGPHRDLPEKLVVHVFYFNKTWAYENGGCLTILNSPASSDIAATALPVVGNSATFVRSDYSWHEVQRVNRKVQESRRAVVVTFYKPGSVSTMWPPGQHFDLHSHAPG
jgi:hypothetical protein